MSKRGGGVGGREVVLRYGWIASRWMRVEKLRGALEAAALEASERLGWLKGPNIRGGIGDEGEGGVRLLWREGPGVRGGVGDEREEVAMEERADRSRRRRG